MLDFLPFDALPYEDVTLPIVYVLIGLIAGLLFDKIILKQILKIWARTKSSEETIVISRFRGIVMVWFVAAGTYGAIFSMPLDPDLMVILTRVWVTVVILSVAIVVARSATGLLYFYFRRLRGSDLSISLITNIIQGLVLLIGVLVILQTVFDIAIAPILTTLGVGGLAVALALQETLANLFAGFFLIVSGKVRPGDYIKLDSGEEGYVTDIAWRNTTVRMLANNAVVIPNSKLSSAIVTNYHYPHQEMSVLVDVGVSYASNLQEVERITIAVGKEIMHDVNGGVAEFDPFIRYNAFADFSVNFTVILRAREFVDQYLIKHEFIKRLHERYGQEGIEIPFPIRTVYYHNDSTGEQVPTYNNERETLCH